VTNYGDILRKRREELGLTQAELSRLSGVDQTVISRLESGEKDILSPQAKKLLPALELELKGLKVIKRKAGR
jgi:HTH-type transcriptional regulator/antitoxin HipB